MRKRDGLDELVLFVVTLGIAIWTSVSFLRGALDVDDWRQAEGHFVQGSLEREVIDDDQGQTVTGEYVVSVVYEYTDPQDRKTHRADRVLAGSRVRFLGIERTLPFTLPRERAERLLEELRTRGSFPVYINPADPTDTGILRMRDLTGQMSKRGLWVRIGLSVAVVASAMIAIVYVVEQRPELIGALAERLSRWLQSWFSGRGGSGTS